MHVVTNDNIIFAFPDNPFQTIPGAMNALTHSKTQIRHTPTPPTTQSQLPPMR